MSHPLSDLLRSRGKTNSAYDINRAADELDRLHSILSSEDDGLRVRFAEVALGALIRGAEDGIPANVVAVDAWIYAESMVRRMREIEKLSALRP